ncbi:flagellar export chaperone FliS [bacterium]|nr:flagellar export chaperone FliS [bacterium]
MNPYLKQYQKNEVETASPEKILILLYDGAIQFLNKAKIAMEQKNIPEIHNNIIGCENIILEFINTVDEENGGDFAVRIKALYQYFYNTLVQANLKKDVTKIDEVLRHLVELRATWKQAIAIANSQKSLAGVAESSDFEG